jgi:hypothetical protein
LGFLLADGCVTNNHVLSLCLKAADQYHIEQFRDFLGSDHPIHLFQRRNSSESSFFVASVHLCTALAYYGVTPRKSRTASASAELRENAHFWRGLIDGDGTLYMTGNTITTTFRITTTI